MKNKWILLLFLCGLFVVYTIDRALLGILAVPIQEETGIDNVKFGFLSAAVFWTYSICVPFSGMMGDRLNRAKLIGFAACSWSLMAVLAGFANGFWSLLALVSIAICIPQTMFGPSASALIAEYHKDTRTIALSIYQGAYYTGWFVSGAAVAAVLGCLGSWRAAYFVFGGAGLVLGLMFLLWGSGAKATAAAEHDRPTLMTSLTAFFGCPTALLVAVSYVAEVFVGCGYATWGPKFIAEKFAIDVKAAGTGVMFYHYAAAFGAILVAGFVTDRLVKRFPRCRMMMSIAALLLSIPGFVLFGTGSSLVVVWISAAWLGAMIGVVGANQFTALFDVIRSQFRSGSVGFLNVIAGLVGSTAPIALGALSQSRGIAGFELGFSSMAVVQAIGALALATALFTFAKDRISE